MFGLAICGTKLNTRFQVSEHSGFIMYNLCFGGSNKMW